MPVAPNLFALKRRLDRYFWASHSAETSFVQQLLNAHFSSFEKIAVIGGLVRDFAREGRSGFRSDIDLVIDAPENEIADLAVAVGAVPNRFGGYGLRNGPKPIDFWALETTWAARHANVSVTRLEDIIHCTFFDWDAVAYNLKTRQLICSTDYLNRVHDGVLDINLRLTPSPNGNLLRSIRRLVLWKLQTGPALRSFIDECLTEEAFCSIRAVELKLHAQSVTSIWANFRDARKALLEGTRCWDTDTQLELKLSQEL